MKNKIKKGPCYKFGKVEISYKQVPFDDRYFVIKYDRKLISKISARIVQELEYKPILWAINPKTIQKYFDFLGKVSKYDKYLNLTDK